MELNITSQPVVTDICYFFQQLLGIQSFKSNMDLPGKTTFYAIIKHTQLNLKEYKTHDIHSHTSEETASNQQQNMTKKISKSLGTKWTNY